MELSDAEKAKVRRNLRIIKVCIVIGILLPVVMYFTLH
jgi:hypothetical protein